MSRREPLKARTMFLTAAGFASLLAVMGILIGYSVREERRILEAGRRTTVTVLSKHYQNETRKQSPGVEIRLDELPGEQPFYRKVRHDDFDRVEPGGTLPYVYDPADPRGGVLGTPQGKNTVPCFFAGASLLILPFLGIGIVLQIRERKVTTLS